MRVSRNREQKGICWIVWTGRDELGSNTHVVGWKYSGIIQYTQKIQNRSHFSNRILGSPYDPCVLHRLVSEDYDRCRIDSAQWIVSIGMFSVSTPLNVLQALRRCLKYSLSAAVNYFPSLLRPVLHVHDKILARGTIFVASIMTGRPSTRIPRLTQQTPKHHPAREPRTLQRKTTNLQHGLEFKVHRSPLGRTIGKAPGVLAGGRGGLMRHGAKRPKKVGQADATCPRWYERGRKLPETRAGGLLLVASCELRTCVYISGHGHAGRKSGGFQRTEKEKGCEGFECYVDGDGLIIQWSLS